MNKEQRAVQGELSVVGEEKDHKEQGRLILVWEQATGSLCLKGGCLLEVRCGLSSGKWANGLSGNLSGGEWGPGIHHGSVYSVTLVFKLSKTFVKKAPMFESGSNPGYDH